MKVFVLGLDGATWDILEPLAEAGDLPNLARLMGEGASGTLRLGLSAAEPGGLDRGDDGEELGQARGLRVPGVRAQPAKGRVNSSRAIRAELVWEVAGRHGKRTVAGGVPMSYPAAAGARVLPGRLPEPAPTRPTSPATRRSSPSWSGRSAPYRPWSTAVHDGGNEAEALADLTAFLDQHLKAVRFLMDRCEWDLFMFDLMATDRIQHELWHVWDPAHRAARGARPVGGPRRVRRVLEAAGPGHRRDRGGPAGRHRP